MGAGFRVLLQFSNGGGENRTYADGVPYFGVLVDGAPQDDLAVISSFLDKLPLTGRKPDGTPMDICEVAKRCLLEEVEGVNVTRVVLQGLLGQSPSGDGGATRVKRAAIDGDGTSGVKAAFSFEPPDDALGVNVFSPPESGFGTNFATFS